MKEELLTFENTPYYFFYEDILKSLVNTPSGLWVKEKGYVQGIRPATDKDLYLILLNNNIGVELDSRLRELKEFARQQYAAHQASLTELDKIRIKQEKEKEQSKEIAKLIRRHKQAEYQRRYRARGQR